MNASWHKRHPMPRNPRLEQRLAWHIEHHEQCNCRPIPPKLQALLPVDAQRVRTKKPDELRHLLTGGDRRSLARSERARMLVRQSPERVSELVVLAKDRDELVSMRALDLLEKLAHERPACVQPYKKLFIGPLADALAWEIRLQIVRTLPLLEWTARERERVLGILTRDIDHPRSFVRAWALDSLATLARDNSALLRIVRKQLDAFERSGSKALAARVRSIRKRLPMTVSMP